jgi:hypothetical protein
MVSSAEEAILVIKRWKSNSSKLRIVLGTDHARMTLHGKVFSISDSSICCLGNESENEIYFDLSGTASISFADAQGLPKGFEFLKPLVVNDLIAILFENGSRLMLLNESPVEAS